MGNPRTKKLLKQVAREKWTPFQQATDAASGKEVVQILNEEFIIFKNNRYTVLVRKTTWVGEPIAHLSIRRNDRETIWDWRDLQRIKNEIIGPENEAIQLFPAETRLVDTSNQYHLYVFMDPNIRLPIGYEERLVADDPGLGAKNRPWSDEDRPADIVPREELDRRLAKLMETPQETL